VLAYFYQLAAVRYCFSCLSPALPYLTRPYSQIACLLFCLSSRLPVSCPACIQTSCLPPCPSLTLPVYQTDCLMSCLSSELPVSCSACIPNCLSPTLSDPHSSCHPDCLSPRLLVSRTACLPSFLSSRLTVSCPACLPDCLSSVLPVFRLTVFHPARLSLFLCSSQSVSPVYHTVCLLSCLYP